MGSFEFATLFGGPANPAFSQTSLKFQIPRSCKTIDWNPCCVRKSIDKIRNHRTEAGTEAENHK
jgi:hypothetical protein